MTQKLEKTLTLLKKDILEMMSLTKSQIIRAKEALDKFDKGIAFEILSIEKRIDAFEIKINIDCENILALYNPVAVDLRFVMAMYSINSDLERIGDKAASIVRYIIDMEQPINININNILKVNDMFNHVLKMIDITETVMLNEDTTLARQLFKEDLLLNNIYKSSIKTSSSLIKENENDITNILYAFSIIKNLERIGDLTKNIAEEIIFYIEAKIFKHYKLNEQIKKELEEDDE